MNDPENERPYTSSTATNERPMIHSVVGEAISLPQTNTSHRLHGGRFVNRPLYNKDIPKKR